MLGAMAPVDPPIDSGTFLLIRNLVSTYKLRHDEGQDAQDE